MSRKKSNVFEKIYLRHLDFEKINLLPACRKRIEHLISDHSITLSTIPGKFYATHSALLNTVGIQYEDVLSISRVHLYKYLVLYSIKNNPEKTHDFIRKYQKTNGKNSFPTENDFTKKDASIFMSYLKQKLSDLLKACESRVKNIVGNNNIKEVYEFTQYIDKSVSDLEIVNNPDKYGARKLSKSEVAQLKKSGADLSLGHFVFNDKIYRSVKIINLTYVNVYEYNDVSSHHEDYETIWERHFKQVESDFVNEKVNFFMSKLKCKKTNKNEVLEQLSAIAKLNGSMAEYKELERLIKGE